MEAVKSISLFENKRKLLLQSLDEAHAEYHRAGLFTGPSVYFHLQSLHASRTQDFDRFAECVYATLASWGMHRMGPGGSKMRGFAEFSSSLRSIWPTAMLLQRKTPASFNEKDWAELKSVFCDIRCMASGTSLVGNSKVMAHLVPNLIPPVDRAYTLTFLFNHGRIKNGEASEWETLRQVLEGFFYPVVRSPIFQKKAQVWLAHENNWDTSELKIVDNLLIGLLRIQRAKHGEASNRALGTPPGQSRIASHSAFSP